MTSKERNDLYGLDTEKEYIWMETKGKKYLKNTFKNLPQSSQKNSFCLQHTNANEVIKAIESVKSDCFTGYDNILVSVMKPVAEYITSTIAL